MNTKTTTVMNKQGRNGKSLSADVNDNENETQTLYDSKVRKGESDSAEEKEREPKELEDEPEPVEECKEKEASNRVKVCLPKFNSVDNTINLYSGEVREERHCYDVTKTICQQSSQIVSK